MVNITLHNGPGTTHTEGDWVIGLVGIEGEWTVTIQGVKEDEFWEGEWDHDAREITVIGTNEKDVALENRLVHAAQVFLGRTLDKLYVPQQEVLHLNGVPGCCQCGATEVPHDLGIEIDGEKQFGSPEKVTWRCCVCEGLVCRNCCLVIKDSSPRKYYDNTYCSELCRACTSPEREQEDKSDY